MTDTNGSTHVLILLVDLVIYGGIHMCNNICVNQKLLINFYNYIDLFQSHVYILFNLFIYSLLTTKTLCGYRRR